VRPHRPTRKKKDAVQQERVATLIRTSIQLEKSQKKLQTEKLQSLMAKLVDQ
jgi:hypothetical protein